MNETPVNPSASPAPGGFDPERAARLRAQAQDAFQARYRKAARITWGYLLGATIVAWWCVRRFLAADDVRSWLVWGVLFILAFETTVLIKLWYWVVNSKLAVLRELKLLRMDLALHKHSERALEDLAQVESPSHVPGLSRIENYAWLGALIAIGILIGVELGQHVDRHYRALGQITSSREVTLATNGSAQIKTTYDLANSTSRTLKEFTIYSGGTIPKPEWTPAAESPWADGQGRKLAVRREPDPHGPNYRDVIQLLEPVPPGQRFTLSTSFTWPARREDGLWAFTLDQNWGYRRNFYRDTLVLPRGAEVVSVEPAPLRQEQREGAPVLYFEAERGQGAKWVYVVKYRLPAE